MILGGWSNEAHKRLGDIVSFDTRNHIAVKVTPETPQGNDDGVEPMTFNAAMNQTSRTKMGVVVALVSD